jgi:hypothetical protein
MLMAFVVSPTEVPLPNPKTCAAVVPPSAADPGFVAKVAKTERDAAPNRPLFRPTA